MKFQKKSGKSYLHTCADFLKTGAFFEYLLFTHSDGRTWRQDILQRT